MKKIIQERERRYKKSQDETKPLSYSKTTQNLPNYIQTIHDNHQQPFVNFNKFSNNQQHQKIINKKKEQTDTYQIPLDYDFIIEYNIISIKSEIYRRFNCANILMVNDQITKALIQIESQSHLMKSSHGRILEERSNKILNFYKELQGMNQMIQQHKKIKKKENLNQISFSSEFRQRIDEINNLKQLKVLQQENLFNQTQKSKENIKNQDQQLFKQDYSQLPKELSFKNTFNIRNNQNNIKNQEDLAQIQMKQDNMYQTSKFKQQLIQQKNQNDINFHEQSYNKNNSKIEIQVNITKFHENINNQQLKKIKKQIKHLSTGIKQIKQMNEKQLSNRSRESHDHYNSKKMITKRKEKAFNQTINRLETSKSNDEKIIPSKSNSPQIIKIQLKKPETILKNSRYSSLQKSKIVPPINKHSRCSQEQILKYESQKLINSRKFRTNQNKSIQNNNSKNRSTSQSSRYNPMIVKLQKKPVYQIAKKQLLSTRINRLQKN